MVWEGTACLKSNPSKSFEQVLSMECFPVQVVNIIALVISTCALALLGVSEY